MENIFYFDKQKETPTPQLIINRKQVEKNIDHAINIAGSADRLWPHVKTHKSGEIIRMMTRKGITRFKCATIAECEMVAEYGGKDILLAYPAVGPNITRLLDIMKAFPDVNFYGLFDDKNQLIRASKECMKRKTTMNVMIDVNTGLDRTGIPLSEVPMFWAEGESLPYIIMSGLHCYDGQRHESERDKRKMETEKTYEMVNKIIAEISENGGNCSIKIMGGTPSFPCYAEHNDNGMYMSPGTLFLNDAGYSKAYRDLDFPPAAAILTRVISNPVHGHFTLDLGYKGIASDPTGARGIILDLDHVEHLFQNEEHWVWKMKDGYEAQCPKVGDELFIIPTHICPTSALYSHSVVVEDGCKVAEWAITARNRKLTY